MPKAPIIGCTLVEPGGEHTDFRNRNARVADTLAAYDASPSGWSTGSSPDTTRPSPGQHRPGPTPRWIALGSDAYQVMRAQLSARLEPLEAQ
jgi:hypothetical protein